MAEQDLTPTVVDNPAGRRYELWVGENLAGRIFYRTRSGLSAERTSGGGLGEPGGSPKRQRPGAVALIHTEVDPAFEGRGLGGRLVAGALDDIRARGLLVVPICPFARSYIQAHPEYADLVVPSEDRGE